MQPLAGIKVVSTAFNMPGPAAAWQLHGFGASLVKVEPPGGDPLKRNCPELYEEFTAGQQVVELNLKQEADRARMGELLAEADVLLTSTLPASLERLGLDWERLHAEHPRLCQVAIVGYAPPKQEVTGHDLTYQASVGLVSPPTMPSTLLADMAGAQTAVTHVMGVLHERTRTGDGVLSYVPIAGAVDFFAIPLKYQITIPGGRLGGSLPMYNLYPAREGWVAVAALEPHFWEKMRQLLELKEGTYAELKRIFAHRSAREWERWAVENRLPVAEVQPPVE
ncbi:MAG: CoA transferase [Planctomycetota bacterium]|nr:MAG: CoA transferase [Planctomycetota bacterium]